MAVCKIMVPKRAHFRIPCNDMLQACNKNFQSNKALYKLFMQNYHLLHKICDVECIMNEY